MGGAAPLTIGSTAQQLRRGAKKGEAAQEAASQFLGTNYTPADPKPGDKVPVLVE